MKLPNELQKNPLIEGMTWKQIEAIVRHCASTAEQAVERYISGTKASEVARIAILREFGLDKRKSK